MVTKGTCSNLEGRLNADPERNGTSGFYGSSEYHNRVFQFSLAYLLGLKRYPLGGGRC